MNIVVMSMDELPPTLNDIIGAARNNKFASAALKKRWHKRLEPFVKDLPSIPAPVYMECVWYVKNSSRDPDNIPSALKYILDALVINKKLTDDSLKIIKSPVIHHFVFAAFDGFSIYFRDKEAFIERNKEDLSQPPSENNLPSP